MGVALVGALLAPGTAAASGAAPVLATDIFTTAEDTPITGNVLANDTDPENDPLVVTGFAQVGSYAGVLSIAGNGDLTFTPQANWNGQVSTWYSASDGSNSRMAILTISASAVNDSPVALDKGIETAEDNLVDASAAFLLAGSTDVEGQTITVTGVSGATGGVATYAASNARFTPTTDLCGTGAGGFDYTVSDGNGGTDTAHVTVDIACVNDLPVAAADTASVTEDTASDVTAAILDNDSDPDDDLAVDAVGTASGGVVDLAGGSVTFTPAENVCGDGAGGFEYRLADGGGVSDWATVTVDIACVNDLPVAAADTASGTEDTDLVLAGADVTDNDTDVEGSDLAIGAVGDATGGEVALDGGAATFTPAANLCGTGAGSFAYRATDAEGVSDWATVTVDLACVNDAPVAVADTASVAQGSAAADYDVIDNDTDVEDDTLTLEEATVSDAAGTASVVDGMVRFAPLPTFSGEAVITYTVSDGTDTATGTLTVTVPDETAPTAVAPTVTFGAGRVDESAPLRVSWSATDAGSGVAGYTVQVSINGAAFTTVYSGTATSITRLYGFNRQLVWRVRATDGEGNTSAWATSAPRRIYSFQAPGVTPISYAGPWSTVASTASSGIGYRYTSTFGSWAQLTFTGREVLYVAPRTRASGYVKVYVDGVLVGRFSTYRSVTAVGQIITRATWGTTGSHRIRIVNDQAGRRTGLDAFIVLR